MNPLEASIAAEIMECPECGQHVHTVPAEGVPAQALRCCEECEAVFFMDLNSAPVY